jgi:hypothetical protein
MNINHLDGLSMLNDSQNTCNHKQSCQQNFKSFTSIMMWLYENHRSVFDEIIANQKKLDE